MALYIQLVSILFCPNWLSIKAKIHRNLSFMDNELAKSYRKDNIHVQLSICKFIFLQKYINSLRIRRTMKYVLLSYRKFRLFKVIEYFATEIVIIHRISKDYELQVSF